MKREVLFVEELSNAPKIFVACSGGVDSMVLLHLLQQLGIRPAVLHCNFQLRGKESDGDERFVADWCNRAEIDFFSKQFDTKSLLNNDQGSIQALARELRYAWFDEMQKLHPGSLICLAHHADDHREQIVLRFIASGRLLDLTGIPNERDYFRRPLMHWNKQDILDYAQEHQLTWREDASNLTSNYTRNKIRNQLIPLINDTDIRSVGAIQRLGDEVAQLREEGTQWLVKHLGKDVLKGEFFVPDSLWENLLTVVKQLLLELWKQSNTNIEEVERFYRLAKLGTLHQLKQGYYLLREKDGMWFGQDSLDDYEPFSIVLIVEEVDPESHKHLKALFLELIEQQGLPAKDYKIIQIKQPKTDELIVLKSGKFRSVKRIFNDQHWPHYHRKKVLGLYENERLLAVFPGTILSL